MVVTVSTGVVAVVRLTGFFLGCGLFDLLWLLIFLYVLILLKHFVNFVTGIAVIFDGASARALVHFLVGKRLRGVEVEALVLKEVKVGALDAGDELILYI